MASRVNVKFVVILAIVLGGVFMGVAGAAWYVVLKSASALARQGDAAMASGEVARAEFLYGKAVAKDQTNLEYLEKWREAMTQKVPESQTELRSDYSMLVAGILKTIATIERTNVDAYHDYLGARLEALLKGGAGRAGWEHLVEETNAALRQWATYDAESNLTPTGAHTSDEWQELRRYSGIALVMIINDRLPLDAHKVERAREDLEAAVEADPEDALAIRFLALWHFNSAIAAARANEPDRASAERERALAILDDGLSRMPGHPDLLLRKLAGEIDMVLKTTVVAEGASTAERGRTYREATAALVPLLDRVEEAMLDAGAERVDAGMVATFERMAGLVDRPTAQARTERLIDMLLEARPDDFDALLLRAKLADERGDYATAVRSLEAVIDLPARPVGLDARRLYGAKRGALFQLINAETALAATNRTEQGADSEHLAKARGYRDRLRTVLPEEHQLLKFADAKIRIAEGDVNAAQRLLVEYNRATGDSDPEALMMAASIAERSDQPGRARELYERIVELNPNHVPALSRLADLHLRMERYEEARERFREVLDLAPERADAAEKLRVIRTMQGDADVDDPVLEALVRADNARLGRAGMTADPETAVQIVDGALEEHGPDVRLYHMAAQSLVQLGRVEEALTYIERGLEERPDYRLLVELRQRLEAADSLEATLALIDSQGGPRVTRLLNKHEAAKRFDEAEMAAEFLDAAAEIDPTAPGVVERRFFEAIRAGDMEEAERLARVAEEHDVDRADGLAFRANLALAKGETGEAARLLERAVDLGTATATVWRLLGDVRWRLGEAPEAIESYREAMRVNPNDLEAVTSYVVALARSGRREEALRVAREHGRFAGRSPQLLQVWLELEGSIGDKRMAIERRSLMAQRSPDDRENLMALASLYIDTRQWERARSLITRLRSEEDGLRLVDLSARWHADRGDLQAGVAEYQQYIQSLAESERTSTPAIALARFLMQRGRTSDALSILEEATAYPDEPGVNADLVLAEELMRHGQYERALGTIRGVLDGGHADEDGRIRRLQAIALLNLGRPDEAEAALEEMGGEAAESLQTMLLRADIAQARGDRRRMRDVLDEAVAAYNDNPTAYFARANALKTDPRLVQDVLQDLTTAIRLDPGHTQALRLRAAVHFTQGREEAGLDDLHAAVDADPGQDQIRELLMNELIDRGRVGEAQNVANEAVEARPGDRDLVISLGDVFAGYEHWDRAAQLYAGAWRMRQDVGVLERYAESLLRLGRHEQVSQILGESGLGQEQSPAVAIVRARLHAARGETQQALQQAARALDMLGTSRAAQEAWMEKIRDLFPPDRPDALVAYLGDLAQSRPDNPWLSFFAARTLVASGRPDEGMARLAELASHENADVRHAALSFRSDVLLRDGAYEGAAEAMRGALEVRPDDVTLNNNLAFVLAERLDRPDEALSFAERAAEAAPNRVTVLDTLAATYQALGRAEDARRTLAEALRISTSDTDRATVLVRLARVLLDSGDRAGALERADQLSDLMERNPQIQASYQARYDELTDELR